MNAADYRQAIEDLDRATFDDVDHMRRLLNVAHTLAALWEAAEATRLERFRSVAGKGEADLYAALNLLESLP